MRRIPALHRSAHHVCGVGAGSMIRQTKTFECQPLSTCLCPRASVHVPLSLCPRASVHVPLSTCRCPRAGVSGCVCLCASACFCLSVMCLSVGSFCATLQDSLPPCLLRLAVSSTTAPAPLRTRLLHHLCFCFCVFLRLLLLSRCAEQVDPCRRRPQARGLPFSRPLLCTLALPGPMTRMSPQTAVAGSENSHWHGRGHCPSHSHGPVSPATLTPYVAQVGMVPRVLAYYRRHANQTAQRTQRESAAWHKAMGFHLIPT